eukprot:6329565-Pyramimonas_sp.AAC.2
MDNGEATKAAEKLLKEGLQLTGACAAAAHEAPHPGVLRDDGVQGQGGRGAGAQQAGGARQRRPRQRAQPAGHGHRLHHPQADAQGTGGLIMVPTTTN